MNGLPTAVKKQDKAADEALAAFEAAIGGNDQPASAAETDANTQDDFAISPTQPTPAVVEQGTPALDAQAKDGELGEALKKLESKFNVLKGKYDSEIPRYAGRVRELEGQNNALKDELDEEKVSKSKEVDPDAYKKYLLEDESNELDPELMDLQARVSRGVAEDISSKESLELRNKVKDLEQLLGDLSATQADTRGASFWRDAESLAPGVSKANETGEAEWTEFLDKLDPTSRLPYRTLGEAAIERSDAQAVANLYNLMQEMNTVEPTTPRRTAEDQVKPASSPSAPRTDARPVGKVIFESEIKAFYNNAAGKFTEAQIEEKEAEFNQAASEGRIVFGK
jgi:hypothetical protein